MPSFVILLLYAVAGSVVIGGVIAAINHDKVNDFVEDIEFWARRNKLEAYSKFGWWSRFVASPFFWFLVKFCSWTEKIAHRGLKNGIRVAATLSLIFLTIGLVVTSFILVILFVLILVMKMIRE